MLTTIIIILQFVQTTANFPTTFGGCPNAPSIKGINITSTTIPMSIAKTLKAAEEMIDLVQKRGIDVIDSGLYTTPTSAISVGLVYDQDLIWSKGFGKKNLTDPTSDVDEETIYRIGSISKILAMLSMMVARDAGKLSLDDPISKHVPAFSVKPPPGSTSSTTERGITFTHLATHMSGLTRESPCVNQKCQMNDATAWQRISQTNQILAPDTMPIYSNLGFEVLGHATKIATNSKSYQDMIEKTIVLPLNLTSTGVNITSGVLENKNQFKHLALPYVEGNPSPRPCGNFCLEDFGWQQPSGSCYSTVQDLGKIMSLMFQHDADTNGDASSSSTKTNKVLQPSTLREILLPKYITTDRQGGYATTFELYKLGNYMLRTKRGDVDGYASEMIMIPELKIGIVVLSSMVEHAQYVAQRFIGMVLPAFDSYFRVASANVQDPELNPPLPLLNYIGTYVTTTATLPDVQNEINVELSGENVLIVNWNRSRLKYLESVEDDIGTTHLFRLLPWFGEAFGPGSKSCSRTQMDDWYELLKFQVDGNGNVLSIKLDFVYGVTWKKE